MTRRSALWHPFANPAATGDDLVVARGEGATIWDDQGREYLDATGALWFCNAGWGRTAIAQAAFDQMLALPTYHTFGPYSNAPAMEVADRVAALSPQPDAKVFLTQGGSDSVETAAKLARRYWAVVGRPERRTIVSRDLGYHGMHAYGTSLGGVPGNADGYNGTLVADTLQVPHSDLAALEAVLAEHGDTIAAFIGEPVIGAGGVVPPVEGYWPAVAELCRRYDVLLIADEVICGFGRLGEWFGSIRYGIVPDLIVFAKGITSGYLPLGGVIVGPRVQEPFYGGDGAVFKHGYTYSGHATACAAALANLDILEAEHLVGRAKEMEPVLERAVRRLAVHPLVAEVRTAGMTAAIEVRAEHRAADPKLLDRLVSAAWDCGVLTRPIRGTSLQISPPLVISAEQIDRIVEGFEAALDAVTPA